MRRIFIFLGFSVTFLIFYLFTIGLFDSVRVNEKEMGPFTIIYKELKGPYNQAGDIVHQLYIQSTNMGVTPRYHFGIYYSDPRTVQKTDMLSHVGLIIHPEDVPRFKNHHPAAREIPSGPYLQSSFPIKSSLSFILGHIKVKPKMDRIAGEKSWTNGHHMEIYDIHNNITHYLISKTPLNP